MAAQQPQSDLYTYTLQRGAKLCFIAGTIFYVGPVIDNYLHKHYLVQVVFYRGHDYTLKTASAELKNEAAILIGSETPHQLQMQEGEVALWFLDPLHAAAKQLKQQYLQQENTVALENLCSEAIEVGAIPDMLDRWSSSGKEQEQEQPDSRVQQVLEIVAREPERKYALCELADAVHLSESRLAHLFKQETGVAVRHYLQWQRLLYAFRLLLPGTLTLTEAAHAAGFSDAAHFSRTCKSMIGISPSYIF